jgi:hypothetical protein
MSREKWLLKAYFYIIFPVYFSGAICGVYFLPRYHIWYDGEEGGNWGET